MLYISIKKLTAAKACESYKEPDTFLSGDMGSKVPVTNPAGRSPHPAKQTIPHTEGKYKPDYDSRRKNEKKYIFVRNYRNTCSRIHRSIRG